MADGGTVLNMTAMNRILDIGEDTVTAEAGAFLIDVAKELEQHGLQFYVNIELGNATIGSLACCADQGRARCPASSARRTRIASA